MIKLVDLHGYFQSEKGENRNPSTVLVEAVVSPVSQPPLFLNLAFTFAVRGGRSLVRFDQLTTSATYRYFNQTNNNVNKSLIIE
jgi:hypothetical protein